jgi:hypothetical protein
LAPLARSVSTVANRPASAAQYNGVPQRS